MMCLYYLRACSVVQKDVVWLRDSVVRNAMLAAPAHAFSNIGSFHEFQLVSVTLVQNQVNGCIDGLHLLLTNDGIALLYFIQKLYVVFQRQQRCDCGIDGNVFQLFEHLHQLGQQRGG